MERAEKIILNWEKKRPVEVPVKDVEIVIGSYFPDKWKWQGGSHIVVTEEILKKHPQFRLGIITIPTVSGRTVKKFYLMAILKAIEFIKNYEEWNNGKKS